MVLYTALASTANVAKVTHEIKQASSTDDNPGSVHNSQIDPQSSCESSDEDDRSCNIPNTSDGADDRGAPSGSDLESKCLHTENRSLL